MVIRRAVDRDIDDIESILGEAVEWLKEIGRPLWKEEEVTRTMLELDYGINNFFIAFEKGEAVATMAIVDFDDVFWPEIEKGKSYFVHKLAVARRYAKAGYSEALLDYAKDLAKRDKKELRLDCDSARLKLMELYERAGFKKIGLKSVMNGRFTAALYRYYFE